MTEVPHNNARLMLSVVSAEETIFEEEALMVFATGQMGELGLAYGHAPLLTLIKPGHIRVLVKPGKEDIFYVSGGILEVQPSSVTVLADSAVRASEIDEAAAREAKDRAEKALATKKGDADYAQVLVELAQATAQLRAVRELRNLRG